MNDEMKPKRKGRGAGKKPTLQYVGVRVDREVYDFYNSFKSRSKAVRVALEYFMEHYKKEMQNESNETK